tara:strand:+ start:18565 stop:19542 length:978 start_codon:yes stop_codon:yes gene_type:complete
MKIILVGTSPAMLLEALLLSQKYSNIEIHEKNNRIGGAWKTTNFFKTPHVETGSHIFAPWKNNYIYNQCLKILRKKLNLKTYFLNPQPENIINNNISKNEIKKIRYFYIKGGAEKILNELLKKITEKKIKIIFNSKIDKITLFKDRKKIFTSKKIFLADQVYLPYYCKLNINNKKNNNNYLARRSIHILLEFLGNLKFKKNISYIQKVGFSKLFDRISNLQNIISGTKKIIFCLRLNKNGKNQLKRNRQNLIKILKSDLCRYLEPKSKKKNFKIKYKLYNYETSYRENSQLKLLKKFIKKNKCELVDTREFIIYISKNIRRLQIL